MNPDNSIFPDHVPPNLQCNMQYCCINTTEKPSERKRILTEGNTERIQLELGKALHTSENSIPIKCNLDGLN